MPGNYGPNHLGDFFDAMLRLRSQRLQEALAKQEGTDRMIGSIMGGVTKLMGGVAGGIQQMGQDRIANQVMNESSNIPRAQSVDRSLQGPADTLAARMPGFHTGGVDELKMRSAMDSIQDRRSSRAMEAMRLQVSQRRLQAAEEMHEVDLARKTMDRASKPLKDDYHDSLAYNSNSVVHQKAIAKAIEAGDKTSYDTAASSWQSLYKAAQKRGIEVDPPNIPRWMSPEERAGLQEAQMDLEDARTVLQRMKSDWLKPDDTVSKIPGLGWVGKSIQGRDDAQQKVVSDLEEKIAAMGGATNTAAAVGGPNTATANPPPAAMGAGKPKGATAVDPATGIRWIWNGSAFVQAQ